MYLIPHSEAQKIGFKAYDCMYKELSTTWGQSHVLVFFAQSCLYLKLRDKVPPSTQTCYPLNQSTSFLDQLKQILTNSKVVQDDLAADHSADSSSTT